MIQDLPLMSINLKIWKRCGFIYFKSYWKSATLLFIPALMNIFEIMYLANNWGNMDVLILNSFMTAILLNSIFRIVLVLFNQHEFITFIEDIGLWMREIEEQHDTESIRLLNAVGLKADKFSKLSLFLGCIGGVMTLIVPPLLTARELPYPVYLPVIDVYQSPYFEIIFAVQALFVMPFIIMTYIPFTNLFVNWLMFGIGTLQVLQGKLERLIETSKTEEEINDDLGFCIAYHNKIITFSSKLSSMLSLANLLEFLMFSFMLCVLLFFILIIDNFMLQVNAAIYIGSIFYVVLLSYWHANEFSIESLRIGEAAYNAEWIGCNKKITKSLLIIIARSQSALQISAGGLYPMTLETFQSLLSASYSYYTVLQGIHK